MIPRKKILRFNNAEISVIGFGGAAISGEGGGYGFGAISEEKTKELLKKSFDAGINIFDTAPVYGFGTSENRLGKTFKNLRDQVFIISKCGVIYDINKRIRICNDPKVAKEMLENSLKNLNSEYIDLYMIHWPDSYYDIRYTLEVLVRAREEGKIKYIGLSNTNIDDLKKAEEIVGERGVDAVQTELNIFNRRVVNELFPYLKEKEIAFFAWGTFDKGIISETVTPQRNDYDSFDARSWAPWWKGSKEKTKREKKFQAMKEIRKEIFESINGKENNFGKNISGTHLAIYHNLFYQEVTSTLCGIKSLDQLHSIEKIVDNLDNENSKFSKEKTYLIEQTLKILDKDQYVF
ncbi:MAG: aldo/keto reductase [Oligoflexia bacterium]|nr:aldo/keto reductase [Oligoflexia bacterium]